MTISIASPSALKKPDSVARWTGSSLVIAKAKMVVKMISGRIAVSAAAAIGLVGISESRKSPKVGDGPASVLPPSPLRSASAAPVESGKSRSNSGVISSDIDPEMKIAARKVITARAASLPARAASAVAVMPVISNATTSGTIVILSALSQSSPMGSI